MTFHYELRQCYQWKHQPAAEGQNPYITPWLLSIVLVHTFSIMVNRFSLNTLGNTARTIQKTDSTKLLYYNFREKYLVTKEM